MHYDESTTFSAKWFRQCGQHDHGDNRAVFIVGVGPSSCLGRVPCVVCVLLAGGADSFNILVPRSELAYNRYQARRSDLALSQNDLLPLDGEHEGFSGLHPR